ncbi:MAG: hypothetical protein ACWA44_02340 [Thiotrichales bacterium]
MIRIQWAKEPDKKEEDPALAVGSVEGGLRRSAYSSFGAAHSDGDIPHHITVTDTDGLWADECGEAENPPIHFTMRDTGSAEENEGKE